MRTLIRFITRKSRGGTAVRDEVAEGEKISVGRGNDCTIHLPDPRVLLHHAEFTSRGGGLYVAAAAGADLRVNDNLTQIAKVEGGGKVRVGPYEIEVLEKTDDFDFVLGIELTQALGDDLEKLVARSQIHITRMGLSMRAWAWLLAVAVLVGTFILPLIFQLVVGSKTPDTPAQASAKQHYAATPTSVWTSGSISAAHKFFGESCSTCHETPFVQVRDKACMSCHAAVQNHAEPAKFPFADLTDRTCQSCHKEHQGNTTTVLSSENFCADCHGDLGDRTTHSSLADASNFGSDHPEFRPTVIKDHVLRTKDRSRPLGGSPAPTENSGLKFPHDRHLRSTGVKDPVRGVVTLECADCHTPNETGETMQPISFERNCHSCHALKFDPFVPNRELVHGKPGETFKQVHDIYDALAMRGGYEEPAAPAIMRRKPGTPLTEAEKQLASGWAAAKASDILNGYFGRGLCGECHQIRNGPAVPGAAAPPPASILPTPQGWTVEPPVISTLWMPKAYFTHARHVDVACADCHAAKTSHTASDVLLPGIGVCQSCHGGEKAADRVPSTCVSCHRFHRRDLEAMKHAQAAPHGLPTAAPAGLLAKARVLWENP